MLTVTLYIMINVVNEVPHQQYKKITDGVGKYFTKGGNLVFVSKVDAKQFDNRYIKTGICKRKNNNDKAKTNQLLLHRHLQQIVFFYGDPH